MTKQPSHSGERPVADLAPDSGEQPFDPSHFGKHEFPAGLREELIRAEKPRIDPKFMHDTVPPNRKPVLTSAEAPATTPRGGFAAPKQATVDRDAPTLIAAPKQANAAERDATTLKVATVKPAQLAATRPGDSPSPPPVDTSRTDPTIILPAARTKRDKRGLVIGVVAGLLVLIVVALLIRPSAGGDATSAVPIPKSPQTVQATPTAKPAVATPADSKKAVAPAPSAPEVSSSLGDSAVVSAKKKASSATKTPTNKPAPASAKTRPGFDPSKPWEED